MECDGECDATCNTPACGFDGGDCVSQGSETGGGSVSATGDDSDSEGLGAIGLAAIAVGGVVGSVVLGAAVAKKVKGPSAAGLPVASYATGEKADLSGEVVVSSSNPQYDDSLL